MRKRRTVGDVIADIEATPGLADRLRATSRSINQQLWDERDGDDSPLCVCGHSENFHDMLSMTAHNEHCDVCDCRDFRRAT